MHDLLNNILKLFFLVVHTIVQLFIKKEGKVEDSNSTDEKSHTQNIE